MKELTCAIMVCLVVCGASFGANLVVNAGFETSETTSGGWPSNYGDWNGDYSAIVGATSGITPYEGTQMLQFKGTGFSGAGSSESCQAFQLIDIGIYNTLIQSGDAVAKVGYYVNRVQGDTQTDNNFVISVRAMSGSPSDFPSNLGSWLAKNAMTVYADSDPATWEYCHADFSVPVNTSYLALKISAYENVYNDSSYPEFDGHFADAVSVEIVPEPATILFLLSGLALLKKS
jgi:hypothetical protein